jgi:twitching motility protein PilI
MLGIRNLSEFVPIQSTKKKQVKMMSNRQYKDSEDRLWRELSLLQLMSEEKFLQIARE